jgi:hypothetical protein
MAFTFKLETTDGAPADPPSFTTVGERVADVDETPVLIVEDDAA